MKGWYWRAKPYPLHLQLYSQRMELFYHVHKIASNTQSSFENQLLPILLYGGHKFALSFNKIIIRLTINFLRKSELLISLFLHQHWNWRKIFICLVYSGDRQNPYQVAIVHNPLNWFWMEYIMIFTLWIYDHLSTRFSRATFLNIFPVIFIC